MDSEVRNGVSTKIFVGFQITSEVRTYLKMSQEWHAASADALDRTDTFEEVRHEGKSYMGSYTAGANLKVSDLKELEPQMRQILNRYCPDLNVQKLPLIIFPQIFIN